PRLSTSTSGTETGAPAGGFAATPGVTGSVAGRHLRKSSDCASLSILTGSRSSASVEPGATGHIRGAVMSKFVLSFRASEGRTPRSAEEAEGARGSKELGAPVTDFATRVGRPPRLGTTGVLGGYVVVDADSLEAAVDIAKGCPGLRHEGGIEVGEVVP